MFDPDAHMPRVNRGMVYLGACLIAGIRLARERQVNVRVMFAWPGNSEHFLTRNSLPKICLSSLQSLKRPPRNSRKPFRIFNFLVAGAGFEPATFGL